MNDLVPFEPAFFLALSLNGFVDISVTATTPVFLPSVCELSSPVTPAEDLAHPLVPLCVL